MQNKRSRDLRRSAAALDPDTLRVGIYCRVSTEMQARPEKTSIEQQEIACRIRAEEMAQREGKRLVIVGVWKDEGVSGTLAAEDRPHLSQALEYARTYPMDVLLSFTDDRYARLISTSNNLVNTLEGLKVRFAVCDAEYLYDQNGKMLPESRLMHAIKSYLAEADRRMLLAKMERGRRGQAERGSIPIRSVAPYGYRVWQKRDEIRGECTTDDLGHAVIVPEEADVVRLIFERAVAGQTLRSIGAYLQNELVIPSPKGSRTWCVTTVRRIINHPRYKGETGYGFTRVGTDISRVEDGLKSRYVIRQDPASVIPIAVPVIIPPDLWQAANDQITRNQATQSGAPEVKYLLTGFMKCALCGSALCGKQVGVPSKEGRYFVRYYVCARKQSCESRAVSDDRPRCDARYVRCDEIEPRVAETLAHAVGREACLSEAMARFQGELKKSHASGDVLATQRQSLRDQVERVKKAYQVANANVERLLSRDPGATDLADRLIDTAKALREQYENLASRLAEIEQTDTHPMVAFVLSLEPNALAGYVCSMLARVSDVIESPVLSQSEKRWMLDSVIERIVPSDETPNRRRNKKFGCVIELKKGLLADSVAVQNAPGHAVPGQEGASLYGELNTQSALRQWGGQMPDPLSSCRQGQG